VLHSRRTRETCRCFFFVPQAAKKNQTRPDRSVVIQRGMEHPLDQSQPSVGDPAAPSHPGSTPTSSSPLPHPPPAGTKRGVNISTPPIHLLPLHILLPRSPIPPPDFALDAAQVSLSPTSPLAPPDPDLGALRAPRSPSPPRGFRSPLRRSPLAPAWSARASADLRRRPSTPRGSRSALFAF
jgi:hypothetical protein